MRNIIHELLKINFTETDQVVTLKEVLVITLEAELSYLTRILDVKD